MTGSGKIFIGTIGVLAIFLIATRLRGQDEYDVEFGPIEILPGCRDVVLLGDSLTTSAHYRSHLANLLGPCSTVMAMGFPNKQTGYINKQVDQAIATDPTDVVVLAGVNDLASGKSAEQVIANLELIYTKLANEGIRVIGVHLTPWDMHNKGKNLQEATDRVNEWITYVAPIHAVVNTFNVTGQGQDGLHLTKLGQKQLAEAVYLDGFDK